MAKSYKEAGVDVEAGDKLVEKIKEKVKNTYGPRVRAGVGGFACLYEITPGKLLAAGTDGVGTKIKLAQEMDKHDTVGIDLVAMCVNDVLCTGATPLFFMDYLALGKIDEGRTGALLEGITQGCMEAEAALIGGETAEMPGVYGADEYDLAGFAVGEVLEEHLLDGSAISAGDTLVGVASSGVHSNGYSLLRAYLKDAPQWVKEEALTPTKIYVKAMKALWNVDRSLVKGLSHVTGGGLQNIPRMSANFKWVIDSMPGKEEIPSIYSWMLETFDVPRNEMYRTFNMGVGLVVVSSDPAKVREILEREGLKSWEIGKVEEGAGELFFEGAPF